VANILRTIVIYNNNENKLLPQLKLLKVLRRHSRGEEIYTTDGTVRTYPPYGETQILFVGVAVHSIISTEL
jgi:hypothetical protein